MKVLLAREMPEWAGDDAPRAKFDRQGVEIPRYAAIEDRARRELTGLAMDLKLGIVDDREFMRQGKKIMERSETEAFVAGRRSRGDLRPDLSPAEEKMLNGRHSRNMRYWSRFGSDVQDGRGRMDYEQRAGMYAESLWSVFTRGETTDWNDPELANARYHWIMDPDAEHCGDCLARAKESRNKGGFTWEELAKKGWPGEQTKCMTKCRCHIRVERRRQVLPEHFDNVPPSPTAPGGVAVLEQILGGVDMPLRLPASGLPYTKVSPGLVQQVVASSSGEEIGQLLPTLPRALVSPFLLHVQGATRFYVGENGLAAALSRDEHGIWAIINLFLIPELYKGPARVVVPARARLGSPAPTEPTTSKICLAEIQVEGYTRRDGTKVDGYTRTVEDHPDDEAVTKRRVGEATSQVVQDRAEHLSPVFGKEAEGIGSTPSEMRDWALGEVWNQGKGDKDPEGHEQRLFANEESGEHWRLTKKSAKHLASFAFSKQACNAIQNLQALVESAALVASTANLGKARNQVSYVQIYASRLQAGKGEPAPVKFVVQVRVVGHNHLYSMEALSVG